MEVTTDGFYEIKNGKFYEDDDLKKDQIDDSSAEQNVPFVESSVSQEQNVLKDSPCQIRRNPLCFESASRLADNSHSVGSSRLSVSQSVNSSDKSSLSAWTPFPDGSVWDTLVGTLGSSLLDGVWRLSSQAPAEGDEATVEDK